MSNIPKILPLPFTVADQKIARGWLFLACAALIVPGITAILLVLLRSIVVEDSASWTGLFRTALVVHVDLSAFIWFMAFAGLFWALQLNGVRRSVQWIALFTVGGGTLVIALTPLFGGTHPILNNYIPVLDHALFFLGLCLVAGGLALAASNALFPGATQVGQPNPLCVATRLTALVTLLALLVTIITWLQLPLDMDPYPRYETLFWGGGHIAQFVYTLLLLIAWVWIGSSLDLVHFSNRVLYVAFWMTVIPLVVVPWIYLESPINSTQHKLLYTQLMSYGHFGSLIIGLPLLIALIRKKRKITPPYSALFASLVLFAVGGLIGFFISGVNTVITAHYHGSIVGITLTLMGLSYHLMPAIGYRTVNGWMACTQPWVYAVGQLLHIAGLLLVGLYGTQRKVLAAAENIEQLGEVVGNWLIRSGGLLAIMGGMLFLIVLFRSTRNKA